jgi:hypothetical protein
MTVILAGTSLSRLARISGIAYLIIFITGIFSNFFVIEGLSVPGDAAATAKNISANDMLFRTGTLSFFLMVIFDVFLAWALYIILIPVDKNLSLLAGWLRLINSAIFGIALYNLTGITQILNGEAYPKLLTENQLYAQALFLLTTFNNTWLIGLVFFGLHLLLLGYLIFKSGYISKFIGILLIIAGMGYLTDSFANFMMTNYSDYKNIFMAVVVIPGVIGELSLTFWLLFKGKKIPVIKS